MDLLVLGGTAFLGRAVAEAALGSGHRVTCLARGSSPAPAGVEFVRADRDADDGLAAVTGRRWDAVVDVARQPGHVRRAVRDLPDTHHVLVSSGNVYRSAAELERDEQAPLLDPLAGDVMADMSTYGEAKVACEEAVRHGAASSTVVRAGLIGGPGDVSGRSGYWPWRFAHPTGEHVVIPDDPDFPVALVDVRDLAAWIVLLAERRTPGAFNATGPTTTLGAALATAADVAGGRATPQPVSAARLAELGIASWMGPASLPLWIDDPDWRGFATLDTTRARAAGLTTRPLAATFTDVLAYEERRTEPRGAGLSDDDERRVLAALDR